MKFVWSIEVGRYRSSAGLVRESAIRAGLDAVIASQAAVMRETTQSLVDGRIALSAWQAQMMQSTKTVHLVGLAVAGGGWNNLNQSDFGWVGQRIRAQYAYLAKFADQLASGKQPLTAQAVARAALYAHAARATHRAMQRRQAMARGMDQERNVLGVADHCTGQGSCIEQTRIGWVPMGTLIPVGSRLCLANCHCAMIYRRTPIETGAGPHPRQPAVGVPSPVPAAGPAPGAAPDAEAARLGMDATTRLNPPASRAALGVQPSVGVLMAVTSISNKPWGSFSDSDYSAAQWFAATLIHLDGAAADGPKSASKLPVREPSGAINKNALAAAAAVLAGGRGGVQASPAQKKAAARALIRLYRQADMDVPDSLKRLAGG